MKRYIWTEAMFNGYSATIHIAKDSRYLPPVAMRIPIVEITDQQLNEFRSICNTIGFYVCMCDEA